MNSKYLVVASDDINVSCSSNISNHRQCVCSQKETWLQRDNGFISVADFCQEIGSQNQGKENSVAQSGNQEINLAMGPEADDLTSPATDDASADKKSNDDMKKGGPGNSQAQPQASDCSNGFISVADFCQEIGSQNQGKENSVAQSGNQAINVGVELEANL